MPKSGENWNGLMIGLQMDNKMANNEFVGGNGMFLTFTFPILSARTKQEKETMSDNNSK